MLYTVLHANTQQCPKGPPVVNTSDIPQRSEGMSSPLAKDDFSERFFSSDV